MKDDRIDLVISDWGEERPELSTDALGIVLRIQHLAKNLADQLTESLGEMGLEWWAYDVLSVLRRQGDPFEMTATDLSAASRLSMGAMTNRIDGLVERGLVARIVDPKDRRKVILRLTREGKGLVDKATETRFRCAEASLDDLTPRQQNELNEQLKKMVSASERNTST